MELLIGNLSLRNSRLNVQFSVPTSSKRASAASRVIKLLDQLLAAQDITPDGGFIARCFCNATVCASKM
jgi:hypothetical protein